MSTTEVDVVVIGAGVVGLACAAEIAATNRTVCVLERHGKPGLDTSTHNSGVVHAGIYYPAGTLKARLCVEGKRLMYEFCERYRVPYSRCGKLIVAPTNDDTAAIEALHARGVANGVEELELVDANFVKAREPHVRPTPALYSGSTGIVEPEALVRALKHLCDDREAMLVVGSAVKGGRRQGDRLVVETPHETVTAETVVNCGGLFADDVSAMLGGETFRIYPVRGEYAELTPNKRHLINAPVYPLPHATGHGLGVHATKTTWGSVLFGPTVRYQDRKDDYEEDRLVIEEFLEPVREILPEITLADLRLAGSGIRAKLHPPEESFADFMIRRDTRVPNLVQVAGIDSPGHTSSLAIAREVRAIVDRA